MARVHNFSAGPAVLPLPVLEKAQAALIELNGSGIGLLETSHRWDVFEAVIASARQRLHTLLGCGDDQHVLFLQGGASSQFFMCPMNVLRGGTATYIDTGRWSSLAIAEAHRFGTVQVPFSSKATSYDHVPADGQWGGVADGSVYLHYTSNNTVSGSQFHYVPDAGDAMLVCDMSSDILSRRVDATRYDMIYAGAQKNLGPSGVTVVVVSDRFLAACDANLPTMLRYGQHVAKESMYNTPNTFGIYLIDEVCAWIEAQGGLDAVATKNTAQARAFYDFIDATPRYKPMVRAGSRSEMNVTFTTGDAALDTKLWKEGDAAGVRGLKGHKSVGGLRASLYNAQTDEAVAAALAFLGEFAKQNPV